MGAQESGVLNRSTGDLRARSLFDLRLPRPALLVSVRDEDEAQSALRGGANVIDIKEPTRGALGMADADVITRIIRRVAGRAVVTAALGELNEWDEATSESPRGLGLVKVGLAGQVGRSGWRERLAALSARAQGSLVAVAYADHQRADAPSPQAVLEWAIEHCAPAFLIDTAVKDGSKLLDYVTMDGLKALIERAHAAGIPVALAGSLKGDGLHRVLALNADVIAVRGAACVGGDRAGRVSAGRVRALSRTISRAETAATTCAD